jgi:photoactive yellow protein
MGDSNTLETVFGEGGIRTVFHPIMGSGRDLGVHGYEALMRGPEGLPFEGPMLAFALAKSMDIMEELDLRCIETALDTAPDARLFLNLNPATAVKVDPVRLVDLARRAGRSPGDLVLEIIEHSTTREADLIRAVAGLRAAGFGIAIDDFGEGVSNLRRVLRLRPDYLKVDRWFVKGCERDLERQAVLRMVARLGQDLDLEVIAEGVENEQQREVVATAGIPLVQGHGLLGGNAPAGGPSPEDAAVLETIDGFGERQLDALPFGVIQLAADGSILQYNLYEENLAGLRAAQVIGKNFFSEVAPCTDVQNFAGRFQQGVATGRLHTSFDFVFTFDPPKKVRVTLYMSADTNTIWVFVQER